MVVVFIISYLPEKAMDSVIATIAIMSNKALQDIYKKIVDDPDNAWAKDKGYLPLYAASKKSKIVIVGQAPGRKAQEGAKPWGDASGDKLRSWLGLSEKEFYDPDIVALLPMDFYYPGKGVHGDLPPRKGFAEKWHPQLLEQMPNANIFILIGNYAQKYYLGKLAKATLTETVHSYQEYLPKYFPLVHPSPLNFRWQTKNPWFTQDLVPVLKEFVREQLKTK